MKQTKNNIEKDNLSNLKYHGKNYAKKPKQLNWKL